MKKAKFFLPVIFFFLLFKPLPVWAENLCPQNACGNIPDTADRIADKVKCLQDASDKCGKQRVDLTSQINYMDTQIKLTTSKIYQTQNQILVLDDQIASLSGQIGRLENSLGDLSKILLGRIVETYKKGDPPPFYFFLSANGFSDLFSRLKYLRLAQAHDKKLMFSMQQTKDNYTDQKQAREDKKKQLDNLKITLARQKNDLDSQQQAKRNLLAATNNDEVAYQNLLEKARKELAGFSAFAQSAGGGLTTFGNGSNGWYYTQRDPQWGNIILPGSSSSVFLAGCAVTSVAMVCKSYSQDITPASIVGNSSNFIYGDLWNWAFSCSGKTTNWLGNSRDQVKDYVKNGMPVILRLIAPSVSGLHFIVAFAWDDSKNDFKIHDPYYGPDKYFSERYVWSQVTTAIVIH